MHSCTDVNLSQDWSVHFSGSLVMKTAEEELKDPLYSPDATSNSR